MRQEKKNSEQHELEIKVVTEEAIPEELMSLIEKNKKNPFRLTFADQGKLYLAEGYGEQKTTGYSVEVDRLCETQETVYIHTGLLGPEKGEEKNDLHTTFFELFTDRVIQFWRRLCCHAAHSGTGGHNTSVA